MSALIVIFALAGIGGACNRINKSSQEASFKAQQQQLEEQQAAANTSGSVSFCAMGDNIISGEGDSALDLLKMANTWGGGKSGSYDFSPLYAKMKDRISSYDIAFVNQETVLGGNDNASYSGYPNYNTPDQLAKAIADAGFDVVNFNSNHSYDMGTKGIEHAQKTWKQQDGVTLIGSYSSEDDRKDIRVIERNGIKIAFLSYCYGQNASEGTSSSKDYYAVPFDKDKMRTEITKAHELADAVVVYMHWGDSFDSDITDEQTEYARFLAGQNVTLTIGSHANVIQQVQYVNRGIPTTDGSGATESNGMLCVYGLGNYISGFTTAPDCVLSGMFTCDFERNNDGEVIVKNPVWHGVVEHNDGDTDAAYLLKDYTEDLAKKNTLLENIEESGSTTSNPLTWAREATKEAVGDAIAVEV